MNGVVLSADNYFVNSKGVYMFDKRKLNDAHSYIKVKGMVNEDLFSILLKVLKVGSEDLVLTRDCL
jgi:hypothetical protein